MVTTEVILIKGTLTPDQQRQAKREAGHFTLRYADNQPDGFTELDDVVAIAGPITPFELSRAPRLQWVHSWLAGPNSALFPELVHSPVVLTSSAGNGAIPLAEHAMLLLLMLDRDVPRWIRAQTEHAWDRYRHGELAGSTVGIFGLGRSGMDLAQKAKSFHMRVVGLRRRIDRAVSGIDRVYAPEELHQFVRECDHIVITAPLTDETRGAFDAGVFAAMKPSATLICVSRGGIVNDDDLVTALRTGQIRAAGLDAHGVEPLPPHSPFWDLPNVILTPHNGATTGGTLTRQTEIFLENLALFVQGSTLTNVVDKKAGY